jgi:thioredoxin reductase
LTSDGYIITDDKMQTNLKGVFAAGVACQVIPQLTAFFAK